MNFAKLVDSFCTKAGFEPHNICQVEESSMIQGFLEKENEH